MIHGATVLIDPSDKETRLRVSYRGRAGAGGSAAPSPPSVGALGARDHISTLLPTGRWTGVGGASVLHLIMCRKHLKN